MTKLQGGSRLTSVLLACTAFSVACGPAAKNSSAFPPKPNELTPENVDPAFKAEASKNSAALKRWNDLSGELGLAPIDLGNLGTLSPQSTPKLADVNTAIDLMLSQYAPKLRQAQCANIESMVELTTAMQLDGTGATVALNDAKVYLMTFKRKQATGEAMTSTNQGLVVVPTGTSTKVPVMVFGHPGAGVLDYAHVVGFLNTLQAKAIVVAPAFAGEKIVLGSSTVAATDTGTKSDLFTTDSDIMLAMLNCVSQAAVNPSSEAFGQKPYVKMNDNTPTVLGQVGTLLHDRYLPIEAAAAGGLPRTIFLGADFGGLTANLALAKAGSMWGLDKLQTIPVTEKTKNLEAGITASKQIAAAIGWTANEHKPVVGCAATLGAPASPLHGEYRIALRYSITGEFGSTVFSAIPFAQAMNEVVAPFNTGTWSAKEAAYEMMKRDALFNAPLGLLALRDWDSTFQGTAKAGKTLFMHASDDKAVFTNQTAMVSGATAIATKTFQDLATEELDLAPGADTVALVVKPAAAPADLASQHIGPAFLMGTPLSAADSALEVNGKFTTSDTSWPNVETAAKAAAQAMQQPYLPIFALSAWANTHCGLPQ